MSAVFEPEVARAIDRCLVARSLADLRHGPVTRVHPRRCGWCDYPLDALRRLLEGFNRWAGWNERAHAYDRFDVQRWVEWARAHPAESEAQIVAAQDLVSEAQPTSPVEEAPADEAHPPEPAVAPDMEAWI